MNRLDIRQQPLRTSYSVDAREHKRIWNIVNTYHGYEGGFVQGVLRDRQWNSTWAAIITGMKRASAAWMVLGVLLAEMDNESLVGLLNIGSVAALLDRYYRATHVLSTF
jgi:hypothetical protein